MKSSVILPSCVNYFARSVGGSYFLLFLTAISILMHITLMIRFSSYRILNLWYMPLCIILLVLHHNIIVLVKVLVLGGFNRLVYNIICSVYRLFNKMHKLFFNCNWKKIVEVFLISYPFFISQLWYYYWYLSIYYIQEWNICKSYWGYLPFSSYSESNLEMIWNIEKCCSGL